MKRILILIHVLFCGYICPLLAEDTGAARYQDSILKVADALPATLVRLTYLRDMAYKHQYAPYNMTFSTRLYEEARRQKNAFYENMGAYYLAACYDKKHDPDSLSYWVDVLKDFVSQVGTYDYYLEQKAAISRALASKRQIEKAVYVAKETLEESKLRHSNNGMIAAYNSLGCAYGVSSRPNEALDSFLEAYRNFSPQTKASLKVDILSRIAQVYGNGGKDSLKLPYLHEMDTTLQAVISKEPETRKNWSNFEIDCEVKYILHYMNQKNFTVAHEHIEKVKKLLEPHVDPVFWLNVQLIQLQYYAKTDEYDKSIALIDEVTPTVLNNYVSTFATLINYKASTQYDKGDIDGAIETRRYLIRKQDSLNNAFSANQLKQVKEIYHIDELLLEKQKIQDMNYRIGFIFLGVCLLLMYAVIAILMIFMERKVCAAFQCRLGPVRVGPWGTLQVICDVFKMLTKEIITIRRSDRFLYNLAPYIVILASVLAFACLPVNKGLEVLDFNVGVFFLMAASSIGVVGILLAGWSSNNKYSLIGAMRSGAQMISYELSIGLSILTIVVLTDTMQFSEIVARQADGWFIFKGHVPALVAFVIYLIAGNAEVNRGPFDLPEAESELTAGYHTEYSGMHFGLFYVAEFVNLFVVSGVAATIFLGGWMPLHIPGWEGFNAAMDYIPGFVWFFGKAFFVVWLLMWIKWTFPRLRIDQILTLEWKYLVPIGLANLLLMVIVVVFKLHF